MTMTWIPGYLGTISIDGDDYTVVGNVLTLDGAKTTPRKPVFGQSAQDVISGQKAWSLSASGHVAAEAPVVELFAAFSAEVPLDFIIQIGEAGGVTDTGTLTGTLVISSLSISSDAEDEWTWSLSAEASGEVDHTPPTP